MPRKARVLSSTGIYHVILRSVNQQLLFQDESDYTKILSTLSDCQEKNDIDILAFCVMVNHIHLLVHCHDNISAFFQSFGTRFSLWYNIKYGRSGHLFQDRFHSIPVESIDYFLNTLVYIHNNPVKAGICRVPSEYRWSSYNCFYGAENILVNTSFTYDLVGSRENLLTYFSHHGDIVDEDYCEESEKIRVTDKEALKIFLETTNTMSIFDLQRMPTAKRNELIRLLREKHLSYKQITRLSGISNTTVCRICKK